MRKLQFTPENDTLARARSVEELHHASYGIARSRLLMKLEGGEASEGDGVCFLTMGKDQHLVVEGLLVPLFQGLGSAWIEIPGRVLKTGREVRVFIAGWMSHEAYRRVMAFTEGPRGWLSHGSFVDTEGPKALFDVAGLVLNQPVQLDLFETLSMAASCQEAPPEVQLDPSFDYSQELTDPDDPSSLCYSRCIWGVDEARGVVIDRRPNSCWEGAHNARLQAAAPLLFRVVRAVARQDPDAHIQAASALAKVADPEWEDFFRSGARSISGSSALDILHMAGAAIRPELGVAGDD